MKATGLILEKYLYPCLSIILFEIILSGQFSVQLKDGWFFEGKLF